MTKAPLDSKLSAIMKAPLGCRIVRTVDAFDALPKRSSRSARYGGMTHVLGVVFQAIPDDPYTLLRIRQAEGPLPGSRPKSVEQWNWVAWNPETAKGATSRRSLCDGTSKRTTFSLS